MSNLLLSICLVLAAQFASASSPICHAPWLEDRFHGLEMRSLLRKEELLILPRRLDIERSHEKHDLPIEITPSFVY